MDSKIIKVDGKIGKLYFVQCPDCKKFIVFTREDTVTCFNCKKKYKVQYPEGRYEYEKI